MKFSWKSIASQSNSGKCRREEDNNIKGWKVVKTEKKNIKNSPVSSKETESKAIKEKIPSFNIEIIKHWDNVLIVLRQQATSVHSNMNKNWIRVSVDTKLEDRKVQSAQTKESIHCCSFSLENEKNLKFVLRGLPASAEVTLIKRAPNIDELKI